MKFATATLLVLLMVMYEMSGGSDFEPRERVVLSQAPWELRETSRSQVVQAPVTQSAEIAAITATPLAPAVAETTPLPLQVALRVDADRPVAPAVDTAVAAPNANAEMQMPPSTLRAKAPRVVTPEPDALETLFVTGSRVNLRTGPGTGHSVLDTLTYGTRVERVTAAASGWIEIRLPADGKTGWMSADFLQSE